MYLIQGEFWWAKDKNGVKQLEQLNNSSVKFFVEKKENSSVEIKYNIELDQQRLRRFVQGLESSIRLITGQISAAPNVALSLRQLLPELKELDKELTIMDQMVDKKVITNDVSAA